MRSFHPRRSAISLVPSEIAKRRQHPHTTVFIAIRASSGLLIVHQMRPWSSSGSRRESGTGAGDCSSSGSLLPRTWAPAICAKQQ
jgi:hypothetical protein